MPVVWQTEAVRRSGWQRDVHEVEVAGSNQKRYKGEVVEVGVEKKTGV